MKDRKQPWLKFYPMDWRGDAGLRQCGYAARGLWIDMLGIMHEAEPYGHLLLNGRAPTPGNLAAMLGGSEPEVRKLLAQLEDTGVFSRTADGVIYSRRMVKDRAKSEQDRVNGSGGGNPALKAGTEPSPPTGGKGREGVNPPDNHPNNRHVNPTDKPGVARGDKAQKPEARGQKEREAAPHARARDGHLLLPATAPPAAWLPLGEKAEEDRDGVRRAVVGGHYLDAVAQLVHEAAQLPVDRQTDWQPCVCWLQAGLDPMAQIVPAIRKVAARRGYQPPRFLTYFDQAVREARAA